MLLAAVGAFAAEPSGGAGNIFEPESVPAAHIDALARLLLAVCAVIFAVVAGALVYCLVRFRARSADPRTEPAQLYGSGAIELAWTMVPLLIVFVLFLVTTRTILDLDPAAVPAGRIEIEVIGHQWWWEVHYPGLGVTTANEIHLPVSIDGRSVPVLVTLRSADVIHSFWVPSLAGKTDLVPGRTNHLWVEPSRQGLFLGQCAEYCGTQHAKMLLRIVVEPERAWRGWVERERAPAATTAGPATSGRAVFERLACVSCHTVRGTSAVGHVGPDLTHLMSRATLGSGAVTNDPENLRRWIETPDHFKPGVLMPAMRLDPGELDAVVSYLSSLE
jgi:cytochrome c oxidase subunit 2